MKRLYRILLGPLILVISLIPGNGAGATPANQRQPGMSYREERDREQLPLPWEKDLRFLETVTKNNTPVLMARYSAFLQESPGELAIVGRGVERLAGKILAPGETFSLNRSLGGGRWEPCPGGDGMSKVASLLYNVAILSNLTVIERHNHSLAVPYVPLGQDAAVIYGASDLQFLNNTPGPVVIWAGTAGNALYMAIYGQSAPPVVTWQHEVLHKDEHSTIYSVNPNLGEGVEKVIMTGLDGCILRSSLIIQHEDGGIEEKDLGESRYEARPQIIQRGPDNLGTTPMTTAAAPNLFCCIPGKGHAQFDFRTLATPLALNRNRPPMQFHNPLDNGKAQA